MGFSDGNRSRDELGQAHPGENPRTAQTGLDGARQRPIQRQFARGKRQKLEWVEQRTHSYQWQGLMMNDPLAVPQIFLTRWTSDHVQDR